MTTFRLTLFPVGCTVPTHRIKCWTSWSKRARSQLRACTGISCSGMSWLLVLLLQLVVLMLVARLSLVPLLLLQSPLPRVVVLSLLSLGLLVLLTLYSLPCYIRRLCPHVTPTWRSALPSGLANGSSSWRVAFGGSFCQMPSSRLSRLRMLWLSCATIWQTHNALPTWIRLSFGGRGLLPIRCLRVWLAKCWLLLLLVYR